MPASYYYIEVAISDLSCKLVVQAFSAIIEGYCFV
nr:MAG TPA: hypothetical protein [Caudoviricetes sp.]